MVIEIANINFKNNMIKILAFLVLSAAAMFIMAPKANAAVACTGNTITNDPWGVGAGVVARIYDQNGNFVRYSRNFTFRVTAVDYANRGYTQAELDRGIMMPTGRAGTAVFEVNDANGQDCVGIGGNIARRWVFNAPGFGYATGGVGLDCLYAGRVGGRNLTGISFRFDLVEVKDTTPGQYVPGMASYMPVPQNANDTNNQPSVHYDFGWRLTSYGTIQGRRIDIGVTSFNDYGDPHSYMARAQYESYQNSTIEQYIGLPNPPGATQVVQTWNGQYYSRNWGVPSWAGIRSTPSHNGWNMRGFTTCNQSRQGTPGHPRSTTLKSDPGQPAVYYTWDEVNSGFCNIDKMHRAEAGKISYDGATPNNYGGLNVNEQFYYNVYLVYERTPILVQYNPWLQTQGGNIVSLGKITGQQIGQYGGRDAASAQKEAEYLIISRVSTASFCSTNHYMLAGVSTGCNGGKYEINPETLPIVNGEDRVISGLTEAWTKNGSGTNVTNCTARNQYFTQALGGHGGVLNNLPSANVSQVSSGARCANGTIWRHNGNTRMNSITYDAGRGTIWVKGNLSINGDIKRAAASVVNADEVPNLGIIVEGNISIAPGVKQIDAAIYSTGKISTCSESNNPSAGRCRERLTVNGLLAATNGFDYGRRFVSNFGGGSGDPAELVRYSGQILAFPPPGFGYFDAALSTKIKYLGEFNPRF